MKDPQQEATVHTGTVSGTAKLDAGVLAYTEGDEATLRYDDGDEFSCRVRMILRDPYLVGARQQKLRRPQR
ncbi:MAG: hypothetical protein EON58_06040 [Alphaproteobacteria bacterium]|jgi:ABC-type antimicrobial peptide transport system ATPase subunit|nr:MAG: hypothetical protein EON58_06040 [Alphaproteobacteria bacterium]